jgi:hypothetical protein
MLERQPTPYLEAERDKAEAAGDWPRFERIEAELERREYDASDPASPQNTAEDARDSAVTPVVTENGTEVWVVDPARLSEFIAGLTS